MLQVQITLQIQMTQVLIALHLPQIVQQLLTVQIPILIIPRQIIIQT